MLHDVRGEMKYNLDETLTMPSTLSPQDHIPSLGTIIFFFTKTTSKTKIPSLTITTISTKMHIQQDTYSYRHIEMHDT